VLLLKQCCCDLGALYLLRDSDNARVIDLVPYATN
jgi:hypothetical protein